MLSNLGRAERIPLRPSPSVCLGRVCLLASWDYDAGDWQNLATDIERPRYLALAEILNSGAVQTVLDIGAGEAHLKRFLRDNIFYVGVEPSLTACRLASLKANAMMVHSTAEKIFLGKANWDAIVFNESIYYCADPRTLIEKAQRSLKPSGKIVLSIYQKKPTWREQVAARMTNARATEIVRSYLSEHAIYTERFVENRWLLFIGEFKPEIASATHA